MSVLAAGSDFDRARNALPANDGARDASVPTHRQIKIVTYDIHDLYDLGSSANTNFIRPSGLNVDGLQSLILSQATLHHAQAHSSSTQLKSLLEENRNRIRGFILYAHNEHGQPMHPVGYSIYYPMIGSNGEKIAYCEDIFICDPYRGKGIANMQNPSLGQPICETNKCVVMLKPNKKHN
jgi:hypothetical protein